MQERLTGGTKKRILAIHDISCIGKCSLTVALPVISSVGIETAIIPTAVLSTHTGGFEGFTYRDLTDDILPIIDHWQAESIGFDALYIGYLGSLEQIDIMKKIVSVYRPMGTATVIDPVMGDNGRLYATFDEDFPKYMRSLCREADIITPNLTEAVFMLGEEYHPGPYTREYIDGLMERLCGIGAKKVVLTGVYFDDDTLGAAVRDCDEGVTEYVMQKKLPGFFHGTGDVFASSLVAALVKGRSLKDAAMIATRFVTRSISNTVIPDGARCYGVNFESAIGSLIDELK